MSEKKMYDLFLKYVNDTVKIKDKHSYNPMKNKKYAVIMACHCDSTKKLEVIRNNLQYFDYLNVDKIIINTSELNLENKLSETCSRFLNTTYYEIPNSSYYDFGKWIYALRNVVKINEYDYIVLTNDSFIIHSSINHFLNLTAIHNVEIYGYNDSTQTRFHYQSYLFSLRKDAVKIFIDNVMDKNVIITSQQDVIDNFEVKMTDWFVSKNCFLKIGNFKLHKFKNIFFTNDELYAPLKSSNLLPFTKLKRINQDKCGIFSKKSVLKLKVENKMNTNKNTNKNTIHKTVNANRKNKPQIVFRKLMLINSKNKTNKLY
jgi:hypothetical protein